MGLVMAFIASIKKNVGWFQELRDRVRKWWLHRRMPPVLRLLHREEGFHLNELEKLIAGGADVNARFPQLEKGNRTALIAAAFMSNPCNPGRVRWLEVCRVLLEAGADPDAKADSFPQSAFHVAYMSGNLELLNLLLKARGNPCWEVWLHDSWLERHRPEICHRLRQWKAEQETKRLDATLAGAGVPSSKGRL